MAAPPKKEVVCEICLEDLCETPKRVGTIPCGHCYHVVCLQSWFHTQHRQIKPSTCPTCRAPANATQIIRLFSFGGDSSDPNENVSGVHVNASNENSNASVANSASSFVFDNSIDSSSWATSAMIQMHDLGREAQEAFRRNEALRRELLTARRELQVAIQRGQEAIRHEDARQRRVEPARRHDVARHGLGVVRDGLEPARGGREAARHRREAERSVREAMRHEREVARRVRQEAREARQDATSSVFSLTFMNCNQFAGLPRLP